MGNVENLALNWELPKIPRAASLCKKLQFFSMPAYGTEGCHAFPSAECLQLAPAPGSRKATGPAPGPL